MNFFFFFLLIFQDFFFFFFSSRRRHTRSLCDWSSDVCSSDLLRDRPAWIYDKNPAGRVPVLEEDTLVLPESEVIMEYLEERFPEPALLPADPGARALERWRVKRFDAALGDDYYAYRRGD